MWVSGKTVILELTQAISERFGGEVLYNKALYKSALLYFALSAAVVEDIVSREVKTRKWACYKLEK